MARPQHTLKHAITSGAIKKNPSRYLERAAADVPACPTGLGDPPRHLSKAQKQIWEEIAAQAPADVLGSADRMLLEIVCVLMDKFRSPRIRVKTFTAKNGDVIKEESYDIMQTSELSLLSNNLAKLGLNPLDRAKVKAPETKTTPDVDPLASLIN